MKGVSPYTKFRLEEVQDKIGENDSKLTKKVFLLANGMIDVHGFQREQAFEKALDIAYHWRENGRVYVKRKL